MSNADNIVKVTDVSMVATYRRIALDRAQLLGFSESICGKVAIVATELATNLWKHAQGGELHVQAFQLGSDQGLELLSIDRGPGMRNMSIQMRDGYSTTGTSGTGLGAIRRQAHVFDIFSEPGKGTVLVARFFHEVSRGAELPRPILSVGAVTAPINGESVCGDHWSTRTLSGVNVVLLADGLGHGPKAAEASVMTEMVLNASKESDPAVLLEEMHLALRSTRGAATAVAAVNQGRGELTFAGVGNISAMVLSEGAVQHLVSHNGTVGQAMRKVQKFSYPWRQDSTLILHSDGLHTNWRMDAYPGLTRKHPSLMAAVLYRDWSRGRDDSSVVVAQVHQQGQF